MIQTEYLNDGTLIKHYSDEGFMLLQVETGIKYSDPVDVVPCRYTYEETNELVEVEENDIAQHETELAELDTALLEAQYQNLIGGM